MFVLWSSWPFVNGSEIYMNTEFSKRTTLLKNYTPPSSPSLLKKNCQNTLAKSDFFNMHAIADNLKAEFFTIIKTDIMYVWFCTLIID